jgi:hypothetical protein
LFFLNLAGKKLMLAVKKLMLGQGRTGTPSFGGIFFRGAPKKNENADKKKKKNYKGAIAAAQQEIPTN